MNSLIFDAPEKAPQKTRVQPVFLSFQGCPVRCVFCEQALQTGCSPQPLAATIASLDANLAKLVACNAPPRELAFYGGTFTLLSDQAQHDCMAVAAKYKKTGFITKVRASTRPDAVSPALLVALRDAGLDMLELGVQSFANAPLAASNRGYDGPTALDACDMVKTSGIELGIQLMPGMPGMQESDFIRDSEKALALSPNALRLYPCLVLAGTPLASLYQRGEYTPWPLEKVIPLLANVQFAAWKANVNIIRIGLAPQAELDGGGIVAGPYHPSLGSTVRGLALFRFISEAAKNLGRPLVGVALPRRFQGEFWGYKGSLKPAYAMVGISHANVIWGNSQQCEIY